LKSVNLISRIALQTITQFLRDLILSVVKNGIRQKDLPREEEMVGEV
jgi:hypothetical protein